MTYYFAAYTDSGCILGCDHKHKTVTSATACIPSADGYVIAVRKRKPQALDLQEEAEFQRAMYGKEPNKVIQVNQRSYHYPEPAPV